MITEVKTYVIKCDACRQAQTESNPSISEIVKVAKEAGWCFNSSSTLWVCPTCKELIPKK